MIVPEPARDSAAGNPLIVQPEDDRAEPLNNLEGGGVLSSWADLGTAMPTDRAWDAGEIGFAASAAALDSLGAAMNPLGALAAVGVGWLIEHVEFLHEPLDWLAGDPAQITAQAHTWHRMSKDLGQIADTYQKGVQELSGWDGAAMQAYREAAGRYAGTVGSASNHAASVSRALSGTGADVGTVRSMIRDTIAERVGEMAAPALAARLAGPATAGGSLGTFLAYAVARATQTAAENAQRTAELLDRLSAAADRVSELGRRFGSVADALTRGLDRADNVPAVIDGSAAVEYGKAHIEAAQESESWNRGVG